MDGEQLQQGLTSLVVITLFLANIVIMWAVWRRTAPASDLVRTNQVVGEIDTRLHGVEAKVGTLETQVAHLPSKDALHALDKALLQLTSTVERLGERIDGSVRGIERVETYLLNQPTPSASSSDRKLA